VVSVTGLRGARRPWTRADSLALAGPLVIGALGSIPTAASIPRWYRGLAKPSWNPPDAVFGPVWTTLYALMGLALVLVRRGSGADSTERAQAIFAAQLGLNLAWSFVFFGSRDPKGALAVIAVLWGAIAANIVVFWRIRRTAALLLVPYLGWVSFASLLNLEIARRNP
jgi:tryptophan-rich sensory protein